MTENRYRVGDMVAVRLLPGGHGKVSRDHADWQKTVAYVCRIARIGIGGVPDIFALEFENGHPVGLPFWECDFEIIDGRRTIGTDKV